jgi:hypothetical protein
MNAERRLERTAVHEAAHAVVARLLGLDVQAVTVSRGRRYAGVCLVVPPDAAAGRSLLGVMSAVQLPPALRQELEVDLMVTAAGNLAVDLFQGPGRRPDRLADRVSARLDREADAPALTAEERSDVAAAAARTEGETDDDIVTRLAVEMNAGDLPAAALHVAYLEASTRTLLSRNAAAVRAVADALLEHRTLGAEHVSRLILDARRGVAP